MPITRQSTARRRIVTVELKMESPNKGYYTLREGDATASCLVFDEMLGALARAFLLEKPLSFVGNDEPKEVFCTACGKWWEQYWHKDFECTHCGLSGILEEKELPI